MRLHNLLGKSFDCQCGKRHDLGVHKFIYEHDAIDMLSGIISDGNAERSAQSTVIVADCRTWQVCGEMVCNSLQHEGFKPRQIIIPDRAGAGPVCDDRTCQWLAKRIREPLPDVLIAVGSGVISDLCKWASFELDIPYMVVATAASMNGYAAANVAAKIAGVKVLIQTKPPIAVVAEPEVIENAPRQMSAAGFADTIAKYQSHADWVMNNLLFGEYYCQYCAELATGFESLLLKHPEGVKENDSEAIKELFAALFWAGAAMTLVGASAPASGGEHLLSHTLDMIADLCDQKHDLHGRQVGLGAIFSAALYQRLLRIETPSFAELPQDIDSKFWRVPTAVKAIRQQYMAKKPQLEIMRQKIERPQIWKQLKAKLTPITRSPQELKDLLLRAGGASSIAEIGCTRERVRTAAVHMHEIRKRCTVVDLAWVLGILPAAVDEIIDEWLIE